jgi:chitodextrinase
MINLFELGRLFARNFLIHTVNEWKENAVYNKNDKVTHNGETWLSLIDNNTNEPGINGWENISTN